MSQHYEITADDYSDFKELLPIEQIEYGVLQNLRGDVFKEAAERWEQLRMLQDLYPTFEPFLRDMYSSLFPRFNCTAVQVDMGNYLEYGPKYRMIQAQRGQAKTTITAAYAVWRLIHNPSTRVLIFSAGGDMASQIALWVIQIIQGMDVLEPLRPDIGNRDRIQRASVGAFDVHWQLKGPDKSPSVACMGITANMQGFRADVLIADDIESSKNSMTELMREQLRHRTRDFTSINSTGDIIYLGTPQTADSIYNDLPARGFDIRIWTGRYPTVEEEKNYSSFLAPMIRDAMLADPSLRTGGGPSGNRGQAVDPVLMDEDTLIAKEIDQGAAYFQLQHMLDTRLNDELRYPLKAKDLMVMHLDADTAPMQVQYLPHKDTEVWHTNGQGLNLCMYRPTIPAGTEMFEYQHKMMFVDPAGAGEDEAAYCVTGFLNGYIYILDIGGIMNGISESAFATLAQVARKWNVKLIQVERNFGGGMYGQQLRLALSRAMYDCGVDDDIWASGQKEIRICETLSPVWAGHKVILNHDILAKDVQSTQQYPVSIRQTYQFMHQMVKISRDRDALIHDDRLDAVEGAVKYWVNLTAQDAQVEVQKHRTAQYNKMMLNPMMKNELVPFTSPPERTATRNRFGSKSRRF